MKYIISILTIILVGIIFITVGPASAQISKPAKSEWTIFDNWTLYERAEIMKPSVSKWAIFDKWTPSETDLMRILKEHKEWLASEEKRGERADLSGAYLRGANLRGANLKKAVLNRAYLFDADLSGVDLSEADVSNADLRGVTLRGANLKRAYLMGTWLMEANLSNANLIDADMEFAKLEGADLSGAKLIGTNLKMSALDSANLRGANLQGALLNGVNLKEVDASLTDFSGAWFAPTNVEELVFSGAKGFASIQFHNFKPIAKLRQIAKESGLRNEEKALTSALYKYRLKTAPLHERIFEYCLFGLPTDFGASPWRSLYILFVFFILFFCYYIFILWIQARSRKGKDGIHKIWLPERVRADLGQKKPTRLILHGWVVLWVGFYFSMLSAFNIGWRELNVGNWIARMQRQEYIYRATGWTRTFSGIQSLISVYLLALWALTYFGRPFE